MTRSLLRAALVAAGLAVALGGVASAEPIRSTPAAGSTQTKVPNEVTVQFAQDQARSSHLEVLDPCGRRVSASHSSVNGARVSVALSATASGRYVVRYFGISATDGHPIDGSFNFVVRGVVGCEAADVPARGRPGRGIWDLPKGDFGIALGTAAVIGALGGLVYASILGPKA